MIRKLYPGGREKAFNISYDDGVEQDVRFVQLLNRYSVKGTFNLNSGLMAEQFQWKHECGLTVKRLPPAAVKDLYKGHEVASHTFSHPYMDGYSPLEIRRELYADRFYLEGLLGSSVRGYATPFYFYSDTLKGCVREAGFAYARISEESGDYSVPSDFYHWRGSKFHWDDDLEDFVEGFLSSDTELALCQLVGHSYDLDVMGLWDRMERIIRIIGATPEVWKCTHIQLVDYLRAMKMAHLENNLIINESGSTLWFCVDDKTISVHPNEEVSL